MFLKDWFSTSSSSIHRIGFEKLQYYISNSNAHIINTLPSNDQSCLIVKTIPIKDEESIINQYMDDHKWTYPLILYGKNATDTTPEKKAKELAELGFRDIHIYCGGLFEWLLLQDIYGKHEFPTIGNGDILHYK